MVQQQLIDLMQQAETLSTEDQLALTAHLAQSIKITAEQTEPSAQSKPTEIKPTETDAPSSGKSIREILNNFSNGLSEESLSQLPTDGAEQHNHYIYGTPKV